jgi:hypothetical protein
MPPKILIQQHYNQENLGSETKNMTGLQRNEDFT